MRPASPSAAPKRSAPAHTPLKAKPLPLPRCCGAQQPGLQMSSSMLTTIGSVPPRPPSLGTSERHTGRTAAGSGFFHADFSKDPPRLPPPFASRATPALCVKKDAKGLSGAAPCCDDAGDVASPALRSASSRCAAAGDAGMGGEGSTTACFLRRSASAASPSAWRRARCRLLAPGLALPFRDSDILASTANPSELAQNSLPLELAPPHRAGRHQANQPPKCPR